MIAEKAPVVGSTASGDVEGYVQTAHGQVSTLRMPLKTRYQMKMGDEYNILPCLVTYATMLVNICSVEEDGKTSYERRRGQKCKRKLPVFRGGIWYLKPRSVGKD